MKKIFFFVLALVAFSSCEEDVKFNNPALQVKVDEELLKTVNPHIVQNLDGTISIVGDYGFETLRLKVASSQPGTYRFGLNNNNVAYYKNDIEGMVLEYSTIEGIDNPNLEDDLGELVIYDSNNPKASKTPGTISGEFHFRGKLLNNNPFGQPSMFFHEGHFYGLFIQAVEGE